MTDQPSEHRRPDDELVAAVLDGEATADERARVEADPVLSARLAEFRAVRDLVATSVVPADDVSRERAIAAAKAAIRHQPKVVPLAERRRQELPRILGVAAALLLVLLAAGFLVSKAGDGNRDDQAGGAGSTDSAESAEADAGDDAGAAAAPSEEAADADETAGGEAQDEDDAFNARVERLADLGAVADEAELASALDAGSDLLESERSAEPGEAGAGPPNLPPSSSGASEACQASLDEGDPSLSGLLVQSTADYAGTPAVVYVYATAEGTQRVLVLAEDSCRVLTAFDL